MKALRVIRWLLLTFLALFLCYFAFGEKAIERLSSLPFFPEASGEEIVLAIVGGVAIAGLILNLAIPILATARLFSTDYIVLEAEGGVLKVSISALEGALVRAGRELSEVCDIRVKLVADARRKKASKLLLRVVLWEVPNLKSVEERLRGTVLDRFSEILPGEEQPACETTVEKLRSRKAEMRPEGEEEPTVESFRPRFPVPE